jgi:cytochrome P450
VPQAFQFNPIAPEFQANPYAYYGILRETNPIFFLPDWNMWFVSRYEDCAALLRDSRLGEEILKVMTREELGWEPEPPAEFLPLIQMRRQWMLFRDPPDHTRLRMLVHKAFTPRMVEMLRARIQAVADALLDRVQDQGQMDVIEGLALPLPVTVIAELLGIPEADRHKFRRWSRDIFGTLELQADRDVRAAQAARAGEEFSEYLWD